MYRTVPGLTEIKREKFVPDDTHSQSLINLFAANAKYSHGKCFFCHTILLFGLSKTTTLCGDRRLGEHGRSAFSLNGQPHLHTVVHGAIYILTYVHSRIDEGDREKDMHASSIWKHICANF